MKLNVTEIIKVRHDWVRIDVMYALGNVRDQNSYSTVFKVFRVDSDTATQIDDWYYWYKDPDSSKLAFKIKKNYWAKGRKMKIESDIKGVLSGEYKIVFKAESNSYDQEDFVIVEPVGIVLDTPRKALNWLERQVADLEAKDGLSTEKIAAQMRFNG